MYNLNKLTKENPIISALAASLMVSVLSMMMYLVLEPSAIFAAVDTSDFTVTQTIDSEIAISNPNGDINMGGTNIGGATGGTRYGSTTVGVTTNNTSGYTLAIQFASSNGMEHAGTDAYISYYSQTGTPDYSLTPGAATTSFAYSVSSTAPTNSITEFDSNGTDTCDTGSTKSIDNCFKRHTTPTDPYTIVDTTAAATDEQTTIGFAVYVAGSTGLPNGDYIATTTLTATTK